MAQNYKYLRLFPLNLVVFNGENLNLHIFEPRYKQLIGECLATGDTFGIPVYKNGEVAEYGAEVEILSLEKTYANGEMDIKTRGIAVFRIAEHLPPNAQRLYLAANVESIDFDSSEENTVRLKLEDYIKDFYSVIAPNAAVSFDVPVSISNFFGRKLGLGIEQEYELLKMTTEYERQSFLLHHLQQALPVLQGAEELKDRIKQNGHYKKISTP